MGGGDFLIIHEQFATTLLIDKVSSAFYKSELFLFFWSPCRYANYMIKGIDYGVKVI